MKEEHGDFIYIEWDGPPDFEYVRGHVDSDQARLAVIEVVGDIAGDIARAFIMYRWARWVPSRGMFDFRFYPTDRPGPGAFPVTEVAV